jgi:geranylgeranyl pyrophosphate synthase
VAVEIAMAAADLLDEIADDDPSPIVREYGPGQALNTANLMLVIAQQALLRSALSGGGESALASLGTMQDMLVEAATGQHLDMLYERLGPHDVTPEMSVQMTDLKAGALISGAMRIGALLSGAGEDVVGLLAGVGKEIGSIAQLTNDVQDIIPGAAAASESPGEEEVAFPAPKTDLRQRKRTLPIVFALRDDSQEPNAVQRAFGGEEGITEEEMRQAVVQAGGVQFANLIAEVHRQRALELITKLDLLRPGAHIVLAPLLPAS